LREALCHDDTFRSALQESIPDIAPTAEELVADADVIAASALAELRHPSWPGMNC
jgi:hypothetical protein